MSFSTAKPQKAGGGSSEKLRSVSALSDILVPHLRTIFEAHAGGDEKWDTARIESFLKSVQKHGKGDVVAAEMLKRAGTDFRGFLGYMTSSDTAVTTPRPTEDLSWPLSSYFICSSHNTYLSGNQLYSDSTTDTYTNVLRRGCRCVEVDVWDGDDSDSESDTSSSSDSSGGRLSKATDSKTKTVATPAATSTASPAAATESSSAAAPATSTTSNDAAPTEKKLKRTGTFNMIKEKLASTSLSRKISTKASSSPRSAKADGKPATTPVPEVGIVEPRVLHGYTLTKEVSFRDVCVAIRDSAFVSTDMPLIVSLEVHCSPEQQAIMVNIMKETWAGLLPPTPETEPTELPCPEQLRNKIIVKVKYAAPGSSPDQLDSFDEERPATAKEKKNNQKKPSKITQELSSMGFYARGVSFKSFDQPEAAMPTHIFSLSEKKFLDFYERQPLDLLKHNKDFLMRAYPSGLRISSSNLNPAVFWGSGTQVVALNWQQPDEGMMLNEGMFAGTSGYVLKPPGYRPDIVSKGAANPVVRKTLDLAITFYAAQSIPLPPEDKSDKSFKPYIKMELHVDGSEGEHGGPLKTDGHEREGEYKTKTQTHRGRDIDLKGERLEFKGIQGLVDELTFLRFTVRDDEIGRDDLAAWACVRLDRVAEGYRFLHLLDAEGTLTDGVVLVKVEKKLY